MQQSSLAESGGGLLGYQYQAIEKEEVMHSTYCLICLGVLRSLLLLWYYTRCLLITVLSHKYKWELQKTCKTHSFIHDDYKKESKLYDWRTTFTWHPLNPWAQVLPPRGQCHSYLLLPSRSHLMCCQYLKMRKITQIRANHKAWMQVVWEAKMHK